MLNVKHYNSIRKLNKYLVFIDPSVYELQNAIEYSKIDFLHELTGKLLPNEFISIDYPCDMNIPNSDLFIEKSIHNNLIYKDNLQYIATIQSKFQNMLDFKRQYYYLREHIDFDSKIIGIGNLCRIIHPNSYTDKVFKFLLEKCKPNYKLHFYGLSLRLIKKYIPSLEEKGINMSFDSTKWSKRIHSKPPLDKMVCCRKDNRDIYFLEYVKELQKYINICY